MKIVDEISFPLDVSDKKQMLNIIGSCIGTKFTHRFGTLMSELALDAVQCVMQDDGEWSPCRASSSLHEFKEGYWRMYLCT